MSGQNNGNSQNKGGSGPSLIECKQIIEQFQGKIFVSSNPNEGTSVYFSFAVDGAEEIDIDASQSEFNADLTQESHQLTSRIINRKTLEAINVNRQTKLNSDVNENLIELELQDSVLKAPRRIMLV